MKKTLFTFSLTFLAAVSMAQETLSLGRCLQMGIERNLDLKTYEGNVLKGKHNISENRARLLPQINIGAGLNDNFTPPVSVTDGSAYGKPYNVTKTLQYNSSASIQLQMPLYSQTALTALSISKTLDRLNTLSYAKAKEDLIVQISKMYYLAQNTEEQIGIIKDNIKRLEELRDITQAFHDNDMALSVDVKRVSVNLENLSVQYDNAKAMLTQQYNMLKYIIDYPADKDIAVEKADIERTDLAALTGLNENLTSCNCCARSRIWRNRRRNSPRTATCPRLHSPATGPTRLSPTDSRTGSSRVNRAIGTSRTASVCRCAYPCSTVSRSVRR